MKNRKRQINKIIKWYLISINKNKGNAVLMVKLRNYAIEQESMAYIGLMKNVKM